MLKVLDSAACPRSSSMAGSRRSLVGRILQVGAGGILGLSSLSTLLSGCASTARADSVDAGVEQPTASEPVAKYGVRPAPVDSRPVTRYGVRPLVTPPPAPKAAE
jgi:hypothetical protein